MWTLSGLENNSKEPILENESKHIRCVNAVTMTCKFCLHFGKLSAVCLHFVYIQAVSTTWGPCWWFAQLSGAFLTRGTLHVSWVFNVNGVNVGWEANSSQPNGSSFGATMVTFVYIFWSQLFVYILSLQAKRIFTSCPPTVLWSPKPFIIGLWQKQVTAVCLYFSSANRLLALIVLVLLY